MQWRQQNVHKAGNAAKDSVPSKGLCLQMNWLNRRESMAFSTALGLEYLFYYMEKYVSSSWKYYLSSLFYNIAILTPVREAELAAVN